mmetsp:Transcript_21747/g.64042  ORF Transcript_21747/g.64042 Transcript_21747/m.64042 type:complete len:432 (-) Transcript_21747:99-1394(-)
MARSILVAASLILGLAALTVFTSLDRQWSTSTQNEIRSLRSSPLRQQQEQQRPNQAPARSIWQQRTEEEEEENADTSDLLAREAARLDAQREAERTDAAAAQHSAAASKAKNDDRDDRNDSRPARTPAAAAATDNGGAQAGARPPPQEDERESDRTFSHLLDREAALSQPASPRTLHLILPGTEPSHLPHVSSYSSRRAARQGWGTKVWKGKDVDALVLKSYRHLEKVWADIKRTKDVEERVRKMGQFMKLVVLHSEGGVYLDYDLVPCAGLDDLAGSVRGPPEGAISLPYGIEGAGRAFASSAGHPVLTRALKSVEVHGCALDGDQALIRAVAEAMNLASSTPPDSVPASEGGWVTRGSLRIGPFAIDGPHRRGDELDLWHLHLSAGGGREYLSKCVKDTEDIAPFLEEGCRADSRSDRGKFEDCGRTVA